MKLTKNSTLFGILALLLACGTSFGDDPTYTFEWETKNPVPKITGTSNMKDIKEAFTDVDIETPIKDAIDSITSTEDITSDNEEDGSVKDAMVRGEDAPKSKPVGEIVSVPDVEYLSEEKSDEIETKRIPYVKQGDKVSSQTVNGSEKCTEKEADDWFKNELSKSDTLAEDFEAAAKEHLGAADAEDSDDIKVEFSKEFGFKEGSTPSYKLSETYSGTGAVNYNANVYRIKIVMEDANFVVLEINVYPVLNAVLKIISLGYLRLPEQPDKKSLDKEVFKGYEQIGQVSYVSDITMDSETFEDSFWSYPVSKAEDKLDELIQTDKELNETDDSPRAKAFDLQASGITGDPNWANAITNVNCRKGIINWDSTGDADTRSMLEKARDAAQAKYDEEVAKLEKAVTSFDGAAEVLGEAKTSVAGWKDKVKSLEKQAIKKGWSSDLADLLSDAKNKLNQAEKALRAAQIAFSSAAEFKKACEDLVAAAWDVLQAAAKALADFLQYILDPSQGVCDGLVAVANASVPELVVANAISKIALGKEIGFQNDYGRISVGVFQQYTTSDKKVYFIGTDNDEPDTYDCEEDKDKRDLTLEETFYEAKGSGNMKMEGSAKVTKSVKD